MHKIIVRWNVPLTKTRSVKHGRFYGRGHGARIQRHAPLPQTKFLLSNYNWTSGMKIW